MDHYEEMKELLLSAEADFGKFSNGNNAAGTRVRKAMQDLKDKAQTVRKEVQNIKNSEAEKAGEKK